MSDRNVIESKFNFNFLTFVANGDFCLSKPRGLMKNNKNDNKKVKVKMV